jgi:hypothetical protein
MDSWLTLVINLPGGNKTLRMRIWRALKASGAGMLRDGVYILPLSQPAQLAFQEQAREVTAGRGSAHILQFPSSSREQQARLQALFDRSADYQVFAQRLARLTRDTSRLGPAAARRQLTTIERGLANVIATDFFAGPARTRVESLLADIREQISRRCSQDEPLAAHLVVKRVNGAHFRGKVWATRQHLWIDRVCSAWLIRRFIDRKAKFLWLKKIGDCPSNAVGFDFNGAQFTHAGSRVTFEVLLASFGLDRDAALVRLGSLVHYLDVGGIAPPEAAGLSAVIAGARDLLRSDDKLVASVSPVLDSLYKAFSE